MGEDMNRFVFWDATDENSKLFLFTIDIFFGDGESSVSEFYYS